MRKVLKALLLTILAYLFQVCAMNQLKIGGVVANLLAVNIAILTVSLGKKYAFGASCVTGILLERREPTHSHSAGCHVHLRRNRNQSAYLSYAVGRGAFRAPDCPRAAVCGLYRRAGRSIDAARARIPAHVRRARKTRSG